MFAQTSFGYTAVVADGMRLISAALAALCEGFPGCSVLGHGNHGDEVWTMIHRLRPDVAVLDLQLPRMLTTDVIRHSRENGFPTRFIVLSTRVDRKTVLDTLRMGANGFVLKSSSSRELEEASRHVMQGSIYVSSSIDWQRMLASRQTAVNPIETLSVREQQVFDLLVDGVRAKDIALRLSLSPKTVDTYRASLMRKLDIHDLAALVKFSMRNKAAAAGAS
jgi:DNA-binding NarL/FixJ family response regulator